VLIYLLKENDLTKHVRIAISDSGMINAGLMLDWMMNFEAETRPKDPEDWRLLAYDFHSTHLAEPVLEYAREHRIVCSTYPTNATHVFQGLDVCVFSPFKSALNKAKLAYESLHGKGFDAVTLLRHLTGPYEAAFTCSNMISAFKETGLHPVNWTIVSPDMLAGKEGLTIAQVRQWNPALQAIFPLLRQANRLLPSHEDGASSPAPEDVLLKTLPTESQSRLYHAAKELRQTNAAWLLDSPKNTTSDLHIYTNPLGCLPHTPEAIRAWERAARRKAMQGNFESAYHELRGASEDMHNLLNNARHEVEAHNANHIINQATIKQQRIRLADREEKKTHGPVQQLIGTKHQYWANQGEMMAAVQAQSKALRKKEERTARRKKRAERKKECTLLLKSLCSRHTVWKNQERVDRQALIEADCAEWQLEHPHCASAPKNPRKQKVEKVPDELEDPAESDHSSENLPPATDDKSGSVENDVEGEEEDGTMAESEEFTMSI
jgi:hypothetical protein